MVLFSNATQSAQASHLFQLAVNVLHNQIDGHHVSTACSREDERVFTWDRSGCAGTEPNRAAPPNPALTSGHHDVRQPHGGLDVLLKGWLDKLVVLFDDAFDVAAALADVSAEPPHQPDVGVGVHEDLHIQELQWRRAER